MGLGLLSPSIYFGIPLLTPCFDEYLVQLWAEKLITGEGVC